VLTRRYAEAGHYPAIDVEASISRVMHEIVPNEHTQMARQFKQALSTFQQNRDLIAIGAYNKGSDPRIDAAIAAWPAMQKFLQQNVHESVDYRTSLAQLQALVGG
jgi:flagellum-specific ATP synthase